MTKPSDAAMRAAQKIRRLLDSFPPADNWAATSVRIAELIQPLWKAGYAMGHDEAIKSNDEVRAELRAEFAPSSDAEREKMIYQIREWGLGARSLDPERIISALSRPAPGWNEACEAIARACEAAKDKSVAAWGVSHPGLEQAAIIARGMRKEQQT